jgi:hypothetical protein
MCSQVSNFAASVPISTFMCLYNIPMIGPHIFLQQNKQTDPRNIKIAYGRINVEIGKLLFFGFGSVCFNFGLLLILRNINKKCRAIF